MNMIVGQEVSTAAQTSPGVVASGADNWQGGLNDKQRKALSLLGQGISQVMVASTLGVSESLISQFVAEPRFAEEVTRLKLAVLQKQTSIDNKHMEIEEKALDKLLKTINLVTKPMDVLRVIQVINATKRRGMSDAPVGAGVTQIVQINLPPSMAAKFITNTQNQIVEIRDGEGARSLVTATSDAVAKLATEANRLPDLTSETGWQGSADAADLLQQASQRLQESGVSETVPSGLRRSFQTKGQITADDL